MSVLFFQLLENIRALKINYRSFNYEQDNFFIFITMDSYIRGVLSEKFNCIHSNRDGTSCNWLTGGGFNSIIYY